MAVQLDFQLAGGAEQAAQTFSALLSDQSSAILKVSDSISKFDVASETLTQTFKALAADGSTATTVFKEVEGQLQLVSIKTDSATSSLKNYIAEQQRLKAEGFRNQATQAESLLPQTGGLQFSSSEASSVEGSIQRIKASIESGSVSLARFQELLHAIQANPQAILPNLTADEARITASLRSIFNNIDQIQKKAGQQVNMQGLIQAANQAEATLAQFNKPDKFNVNQVNQFEAAVLKIRAAIESGSVSLERFNQLLSLIKSDKTTFIPGLTEDETKVTRALREMQEGFKKTGQAGADGGQAILISWQGVFRLFQAQVIKRVAGFFESSVAGSVKDSADFSTRVAEIQTISQKASISTEEWSTNLRELSKQFGATNADVAEAAYQALSNQVTKGVETFGFLETALKFGRATNTSAADSVNLLSSALKSYNLSQEDTSRVASIFFNTITLGRIRAKDLADTFGRVGTVAHEVGISLEETAAALATLTTKGIKPDEAMTLLNNLLLKLVRPTAEMIELFKEWGVASGPAAIATFGFEGVLQKFNEEAQKGTSRLGELTNQIRAFRSLSGLAGSSSSFGDFSSKLIDIKSGKEQFEQAGVIMGKALGVRLKEQGQEIRNFFIEDFGDRIVTALVTSGDKIASIFGSITNVLKFLEGAIKLVGTAYVSYLAPITAVLVATKAYDIAAKALSFTLSEQATALSAVQVVAASFAVGFTLGQYLFSNEDLERLKKIREELEKTVAARIKYLSTQDPVVNNNKKTIDDVRERFDKNFQIAAQYYAKQLSLVEGLKARSIDAMKETNDALKVSSKTLFDSFTNRINDLRKIATEAETAIKQSLKTSEDITRRQGETISAAQFKYANPGHISGFTGLLVDNQRLELMKSKIQDITAFARDQYKVGTKESIDDARKLFGEAEKLTGQLFDEEIRKQRAEFDERVRRGTEKPQKFEFDPVTGQAKAIYEFKVKTESLQERLNGLVQEQLKFEEKVRESAEAAASLKKLQIETEKEKLRTLQQSFAELEKIQLFDKKGAVKPEFKQDPRSALAEFDRLGGKIQSIFNDQDIFKQFQVASDLAKQRIALANQVAVAEKELQLRTEEEKITISKKAVQDRITLLQEELSAANSKIIANSIKLQTDLGTITQGKEFGGNVVEKFPNGNAESVQRIEELRKSLKELVPVINEQNEAFAKNKSAENFSKLSTSLKDFTTKYEELAEKIRVGKGDAVIAPETQERIDNIKAAFAGLQSGVAGLANSNRDIQKLVGTSNDFQRTLQDIPGAMDAMVEAAAKSAPAVSKSISQITQETGGLVGNLGSVIQQLEQLKLELPGLRALKIDNAEGNFYGGYPKYMNAGGFVGFVPRGSDTIPAMLNPKEYVMTEGATNQFLPILKAMNSGAFSRGSGASNVTNVGDISINVQGGNTSAETLKHVAKGLRRGLKRGTISLS